MKILNYIVVILAAAAPAAVQPSIQGTASIPAVTVSAHTCSAKFATASASIHRNADWCGPRDRKAGNCGTQRDTYVKVTPVTVSGMPVYTGVDDGKIYFSLCNKTQQAITSSAATLTWTVTN